MKKETSHRSNELKTLGWNQEEIIRYEELFEYSQRWGLINLEREDRQFLKKAEKVLPKIQSKKASVRKSIEEKSYYKWLKFYLDQINQFDESNVSSDLRSVWKIMLEEELKILNELKPVLGLPDTIKAKELSKIRSSLVESAIKDYKAISNDKTFDFNIILSTSVKDVAKNWKSIIERDPDENKRYLLVNKEFEGKISNYVNKEIARFMKEQFPSLKENL